MRLQRWLPAGWVLAFAQGLARDGAEENCESDYWLRVHQGLLLPGGRLPDAASAELLTPTAELETGEQTCGCHVGLLTLSSLRLAYADPGDRRKYLLHGFGAAFGTLSWWPYARWPLFGTLSFLRQQVREEISSGGFPTASCDFLRGAPSSPEEDQVAQAGKQLLSAMQGASTGGASAVVEASNFLLLAKKDTACPLALAAAFWTLAEHAFASSQPESRRLVELGEETAKSSEICFLELLTSPWPLLELLARLELRLREPQATHAGDASPVSCALEPARQDAHAAVKPGTQATLERWPEAQSVELLETGSPPDPLNPVCAAADRSSLRQGLESQWVEAIVVYGRRDRFEILHRYLQRNLRANGGVLDRVNFVVFVALAEDLEYLDEVMAESPGIYVMPQVEGSRLAKIYSVCKDPATIYVKIDDDIVYMSDEAIPEMVRERMRQRCSIVSANVINHAILSAIHQDIGAVRSFFPVQLKDDEGLQAWVRDDDEVPMAPIEKKAQSECVWNRWECAAWMHISFLSRLDDGTACAYDFGWHDFHAHGFGGTKGDKPVPWAYSRWSINMIAFTAADVVPANLTDLAEDDEYELSFIVPRRLQKRSCAVGRAIVAHFTYARQEEGVVENTDLLEQYRNLSLLLANVQSDSS